MIQRQKERKKECKVLFDVMKCAFLFPMLRFGTGQRKFIVTVP